MAITATSLEVTETPVACNEQRNSGARLVIRNAGRQGRVANLGPADLVFGEAFELDAGDTVTIDVQPLDVLYAVSNAAGTTLKILRTS